MTTDIAAPADDRVTTPEAARLLGISGREVYHLIFTGRLDGAPGPDGIVRIPISAVAGLLPRAPACVAGR